MALSDQQAACLLEQAGWPQDLIPTMVAVGHAESGLDPGAVNTDPQVAQAPPTGWLQVRAFGDRTARWNLRDPLQNAQAALAVYQAQGLGAWETYPSQAAPYLSGVRRQLSGFDYGSCGGKAAKSAAGGTGTGLLRGRQTDPWGIGQGIADAAGYSTASLGVIGRQLEGSGQVLLGLLVLGLGLAVLTWIFLNETEPGRALGRAGRKAAAAAVLVPK